MKPITYAQLVKYIKADDSLEIELAINETSRTIFPELKEAFDQTILPNVADTIKDYLYSTLWTVISKDANKMVGDICIVGEPNSDGEIEIGYGRYDEFQKKRVYDGSRRRNDNLGKISTQPIFNNRFY